MLHTRPCFEREAQDTATQKLYILDSLSLRSQCTGWSIQKISTQKSDLYGILHVALKWCQLSRWYLIVTSFLWWIFLWYKILLIICQCLNQVKEDFFSQLKQKSLVTSVSEIVDFSRDVSFADVCVRNPLPPFGVKSLCRKVCCIPAGFYFQ